MEMYSRW